MRTYKYRAQNTAGTVVEGTIRAGDARGAHHLLEKDGLVPVRIDLVGARKTPGTARLFGGGVKDEDLIIFTRQLGTMLNAGIPILQTLEALRIQTESAVLKKNLAAILSSVNGGSRLSEAMAEFPKTFSAQYVSIVASGESGADLVQSLASLSEWMEREREIKTEVKSALRYPLIVVVALFFVAWLLAIKVIPELAKFFARSTVPLPLPTRMLVKGNILFQHYWPIGLAVVVIITAAVIILLRIPSVRLSFDRLKFKLPVFGPIYSKIAISRFSRIFAMLIRNGVPVVKALDIAPAVVGNAHLSALAREVRQSIEAGNRISEAFSRMPILPPMVTSLIAVGEKTGTLDDMLDHVVAQYDTDLKYTMRNLPTTIEPIITVVIGIGVLFLALALFLPMWSMSRIIIR